MAIDVDQEWVTLQEAAKVTGKNTSALRGAILRKKITKAKKEAGAIGDYWLIHKEELEHLKGDRSRAIDRVERAIEGDRTGAIDRVERAIEGDRTRAIDSDERATEGDRTRAIDRDERATGSDRTGAIDRVERAIEGDRTRAIDSDERATEGDRTGAIDRDERINGGDRTGAIEDEYETTPGIAHVNLVTIEYYDQQRERWERERTQLEQGVMMYRYKFEEMDRQIKALPAPPEYVKAKIEELEQSLKDEAVAKEQALQQLRDKLEEEERLKEEIRVEKERLSAEYEYERRRSWWKKLWGMR